MRKYNVILKSIGVSVFACTATVSAHATDWSVTKSIAPYSLIVSASSCYEEPDKMKVSFDWTKSLAGYDRVNAAVECGCGQSIVLNDEMVISPDSLIELVSKDFPLDLSTYKCTDE